MSKFQVIICYEKDHTFYAKVMDVFDTWIDADAYIHSLTIDTIEKNCSGGVDIHKPFDPMHYSEICNGRIFVNLWVSAYHIYSHEVKEES